MQVSGATEPRKQSRPWLAGITAVAVVATGFLLPTIVGGSSAAAAEGPAPAPTDYRVLETEHSDTIAAFWDDGDFTLGAKADVDGDLGVRFPADGILVHVNDLAKYDGTWPAGYEFVADPASTVWVAPQTREAGVVWPGFSTESVPSGVVDGPITFTLDSVTGPGDVEVWTTGDDGGVHERLWSSDEAIKSFTRPINTHLHANWAFTQPGTYQLTATASATTNGGAAVADTKTYTFHAGPLPEQVSTSLDVHADGETSFPVGGQVGLHATVTPRTVEGYVEFRDGAAVLGHVEVRNGEAEFDVTGLGIGAHSVTSHFVPKIVNFTTGSDAGPVSITVTDETGVPFSITGIQESYQPGDTLVAQVAGVTLGEKQMFRWMMRPVGGTSSGSSQQRSVESSFTRALTASNDGYEIRVELRNCTNTSCSSGSTEARTAWVPIRVLQDGAAPSLTRTDGTGATYPGYSIELAVSDVELAEGETWELVHRMAGSNEQWTVWNNHPDHPITSPEPNRLVVGHRAVVFSSEYAVRVVRDGIAVRQSAPVFVERQDWEVKILGMQSLYREGGTMNVTGSIYPEPAPEAGFEYRFSWFPVMGMPATAPTADPDNIAISLPNLSKANHNGKLLTLFIYQNGTYISYSQPTYLYVTDSAGQIVSITPLAEHYHQRDRIKLDLVVDPSLSEGDIVTWEWLWPGQDWAPIPGVEGLSSELIAEQALSGVQMRATVDFAQEGVETTTADPVTIDVNDHGAAAVQKPTITGTTSVTDGDTVTLTRTLPENGQTILTEHRWERQAAGSDEWTTVEGESGAELSFAATLADDGAQYRVSILKPGGEIAYGPSPAVTLEVAPGTPEGFAITGIQGSYNVGDSLSAEVVGVTLEEGQTLRWLRRPVGATSTGQNLQTSTSPSYTRAAPVTMADHDYELSVAVRAGSTVIAQTGWVRIDVAQTGAQPELTREGSDGTLIPGDSMRLVASSLDLAEGESVRFVQRQTGGPWSVIAAGTRPPYSFSQPETHILEGEVTTRFGAGSEGHFAVQVLRDELPVRQSAPVPITTQQPEVIVEGLQGLYMEGASAQLSATAFPHRDGLVYQWQFSKSANFAEGTVTVLGETTNSPATLTQLLNVGDHNEGYLRAIVTRQGWVDSAWYDNVIGVSDTARIFVTDDPDAQLFFFNNLSAHYHQGDTIALNLTVTPEPLEGDRIVWEWMWPGTDWTPFPGASGMSSTLKAEQALEGVQVRATLEFASGRDPILTDPVMIHVDDHGSAARQKPTIGGATMMTAGDTVTLVRELPSNGQTILTEHRWERQAAGSGEWATVEGESGAELSFAATLADDGAQYRVSILKPGGQLAYGPSPAVTLAVQAGAPVATVPAAPAKPGITANGTTVAVTWVAPADGGSPITGYAVTLSPESGDPISLSVSADATSVTFTDVPEGVWTAVAAAANEVGSSEVSPVSDPVTVTATEEPGPDPDPTTPQAPAQPGIAVDGNTVSVTWVAPTDGGSAITGYTVTLFPESGDPISLPASADVTTVVFADVPEGVWTAAVVATNEIGSSPASAASASVTVTAPEPTAPQVPAQPGITVDGATVSVTWVAPADGGSPITGYTVRLAPESGDAISLKAGADATSTTFTDVPAGAWTAEVVANNAVGSSAASVPSVPVTVAASEDPDPEPEPVDPTPVPDAELTDAARGGVQVPEAAAPGAQITVEVGAGHAGEEVRVWLHSTPALLGTVTLDAAGNTVVTIPANAALGDHRIVVQAVDGSLIGWDAIKIGSASQSGASGERIATTGSGQTPLLFTAGAVLLLLAGGVAFAMARSRRQRIDA